MTTQFKGEDEFQTRINRRSRRKRTNQPRIDLTGLPRISEGIKHVPVQAMAIVGLKQHQRQKEEGKVKDRKSTWWNEQQVLVVPPSPEIDRWRPAAAASSSVAAVQPGFQRVEGDEYNSEVHAEEDVLIGTDDEDETPQLVRTPSLIQPQNAMVVSKSTPESLFQKG